MRVLITGGAGFIGSTVSDKLLEQQHEVVVIDNYETGLTSNNQPHINLKVREGSITDNKFLTQIFEEYAPEVVLHAAASYKDPEHWEDDVATNIVGTINVVRASKVMKVNRLVYLQTSLCYGLEPLEKPITLQHPLFGNKQSGGSSYAISKTAAEQYIALSGLEFVSLRLANVFGPRNLSGPLPTFFDRLSQNLTCKVVNTKIDFIYVDDVVNVIFKAIMGVGSGYYHIATGIDHEIQEVYNFVLTCLDKQGTPAQNVVMGTDDVYTILLDASKTIADFDWKVETSLETGIKKTIEWYTQHKLEKTYTHLKNIY